MMGGRGQEGAAMGETLGTRLQALRLAAELTQEVLAARSGLPVTSLRNWERDHRTPGVFALFKLAQALGLPMERFVEGVEGDDSAGPAAGGEPPTPQRKPRRRRSPKARGG
jgi:transcriptional regulator with XRE-family HTH domain